MSSPTDPASSTPATGAPPATAAAAAPVGRIQIGPPIEKILAIPTGLDGLTPLQAADCFLKSEEFYVERALRVATEMETRLRFHIKLNKTVLLENEIAPLFINLQSIYAFNKKFYQELLKLRLHGDLVASVGQCMVTHVAFFKLYREYIKDYRRAQTWFDVLVEKKKKFSDWLDLNEMCAGYSLKTLLLAPVSRMPQYLIFLGAIVRSLDPESDSAKRILQAITAVSQVSDDIAFALKDEVSRKLVVTIQAKIFGNNCNLISPSRFVVKHSDLKKMYNKSLFGGSSKIYLFILFNDCLIYGTRPGKLSYGSVKHVLPLIGMSIEEVSDDEKKKVKNGFKINSNTKSFVCCAINGPTKQGWVKALRDQIAIANASASTLHKGQQAADEFERILKTKATKADQQQQQQQQQSARQPPASNPATGSVIQTNTAQQRTFIPIQSAQSSSNLNSGGPPAPSAPSPSTSFNQPPPPPTPSSYAPPPTAPPPTAPPAMPPRPGPPAPPSAPAFAAPPPVPPRFNPAPPPVPPSSSFAPPPVPSGYQSGYQQEYQQEPEPAYDSYANNTNDNDAYYNQTTSSYAAVEPDYPVPSAPTLEYDIPVVSASAPPPPPMAPSAPAFTASPKTDLLSQIQAGKQLRSTEPQWKQILDPSSGAFYYEHKTTGESTWDQPASFIPAAGTTSSNSSGGGSILSGANGQSTEAKLKETLNRYRQFVQDDEDDVGEEDEWD